MLNFEGYCGRSLAWLGHQPPTISNIDLNHASVDWNRYSEWLEQNYAKTTQKNVWTYSRKYFRFVLEKDLTELARLNNSVRNNTIKALIVLSKFLGELEDFKTRLKSHGIKETSHTNSVDAFLRMMNAGNSNILQYYRDIQQHLRPNERLFSKFLLVSGLRMTEAITSFNMIIKLHTEGRLGDYFNADLSALEHFKYKEQFLRGTKNCFITFIDPALVSEIANSTPVNYAQIRKRLLKEKLGMRFNEFRDYFATYMLKHGIVEYECNMVQGRINPDSILTKHYLSPSFTELRDRILANVELMLQELS